MKLGFELDFFHAQASKNRAKGGRGVLEEQVFVPKEQNLYAHLRVGNKTKATRTVGNSLLTYDKTSFLNGATMTNVYYDEDM